jgi:hypothetical protein
MRPAIRRHRIATQIAEIAPAQRAQEDVCLCQFPNPVRRRDDSDSMARDPAARRTGRMRLERLNIGIVLHWTTGVVTRLFR